MKQKLIDLASQRANALTEAETALNRGDQAAYDAAMERVRGMNKDMERIQVLLTEQERQAAAYVPTAAEVRDVAEEMGARLMAGDAVTFSAAEIMRSVRNDNTPAGTLYTGALVQPTQAGSEIHDPLGNHPSSIVDQVRVVDLTGLSGFAEPYVISEIDAKTGTPAANSGTTRTTSTDPSFGVAEIKGYEMTTTSFVDRNISRLSPANYFAKVRGMAMRAMRRKLAGLIVNGDGGSTPVFYGMKNATNKAGSAIYATETVTAVNVDLLDLLYFAYGSTEEVGANARLFLNKKDLRALGSLRGTNEKQRLLKITPDDGNANTGVISDGGLIVPYTIVPDLTALSGTTASASAAIQTMVYGDPMNFEVGLFGDYTVRVDESVKAVERMYTILGDAVVGGNLIVHKGAVVATVAKTGT